jgi:aspartyl-tRNA(Asn)/glutamyl-tRNA(Gln) amidotransferase subunit A
MDKIGAVARNTEDVSLLLEVISGKDEGDSTNLGEKFVAEEKEIKKIAYVKEFVEACNKDVQEVFMNKIEELKKFFKVEKVSLPLNVKYAMPAYYIIATSEASTNLAKLSGLRYGKQGDVEGKHFDEYFSEIRSENFTEEAKRRIILGTFARMSGFRDAYYLKAMKVRTKLINEYKKAFEEYDLLLHPTMPIISPKFLEIEKLSPLENYAMDLLTIPANLAGMPHLSINSGFVEKMPVGLMITANHLQEKKIYTLAKVLESE